MGIAIAKPAFDAGILSYKNKGNVENAENKQNKKDKKTSGTGAAVLAGIGISSAYTPVSLLTMNGIAKMQKKLKDSEVKLLNEAGEKILNVTNMRGKGVSIEDVNYLNTLFNNNPQVKAIASGKNAGFSPVTNQVLISKNRGAALQFHELGHAYNFNVSKAWKILQNFRIPAMLLSFGLIIYAACTKDAVAKEGEELTKAQKTKNFIRHNAGKLAFGSMVPVLAEEGMASIRGCKWAKEMLSSEMFKHVLKTNAFAYTTYVGAAAAIGLAAWGAVKIKDHFVAKKEQEAQQTQQSEQIAVQPNEVSEKEEIQETA